MLRYNSQKSGSQIYKLRTVRKYFEIKAGNKKPYIMTKIFIGFAPVN